MTSFPPSRSSRRLWPVAAGFLLAFTLRLGATIPAAALADPRAPLGYLVVTYYSGVDNTGATDSTAGIQTAIDDAQAGYYAVFFPAGTYKISSTLQCFNWALWVGGAPQNPSSKSPALIGSKLGASRPKIILASGAVGFNDPAKAKPMIAYRELKAANASGTAKVAVANAFEEPANFTYAGVDLFNYNLCNLDFDCNGNTGAVGVAFDGAQGCTVQNTKVFATGAFAGFVDLPGPGGVGNIEVEGGQYGVIMGGVGSPLPGSWPSTVTSIAGLRLQNQSVASLVIDNGNGAVVATGFYIKPGSTGQALKVTTSTFSTARGTFVLLDGVVDMVNHASAYAIDNSGGKSAVLRNVYVTNTTNLIKSSGLTTAGSGTWNQISEYSYTDQSTGSSTLNSFSFNSYSIVDGVKNQTAERVKSIVNSATAPSTEDLIARHTWLDLPTFEDGATGGAILGVFENPLDYGATPETTDAAIANPYSTDSGPSDTQAFQQAIDAASAAGHGRVVIPRGAFHLSEATAGGYGLTLHANTKLFGASLLNSKIAIHSSWQPNSGSPVMIQTDDDPFASTYFGYAQLVIRRIGGTLSGSPHVYLQDRFSQLLWRAGRNSMTMNWQPSQQFLDDTYSSYPRYNMKFTGGGGGRHHGFDTPGRGTGGTGFRGLIFSGTTEPVWFYTANVEASKGAPTDTDMNIEINGAQNIRLIGLKREGYPSPTVRMTNAINVGLFGHELRGSPVANGAGDIQITGTSNNILLGISNARQMTQSTIKPLINETITGQTPLTFDWPQALSIYKRGSLDDAKLIISPGLPSPWLTADVGAVGAAGIARYDKTAASFTVVGSGANIWADLDEFRFVQQTWNGDAVVIAKVSAITNTNTYAKAGVMIRKSLAANSAHATVNITPGGRVEFLRRTADGNTITDNPDYVTDAALPKWLKLVRVGDNVKGYYSNNGTSWTQLGSAGGVTVSLGAGSVQAGLVVCASNDGALNTSTFSEVSVAGAGPLQSQDIGNPGVAGSASVSSGVYTVAGGGADIYGTSDQFHYAHQGWTGDGSIIARVTSVQNTYNYAKAGLMFRDDLTAGSANVNLSFLAIGGTQFLRRATSGGTTVGDPENLGLTTPYWLRLERHGDIFTGWQSPDGVAWWFTGADTVTLNSGAQVGLAVTAHNNSLLNTSVFDNVTVSAVPMRTAADVGAVGAAGSTGVDYLNDITTINAAGANIWSTADSFHFYYQPWIGDVTVVALVTTLENTSPYAKAGVMIRQSLAANSAQATANLSIGNGAEFLVRTTSGGTTTNAPTAGITVPRWVKLVRSGNSFSAYQSADTATWIQIGTTQTITMTGTVYVGLIGCSIINTTNLGTSTFENFYVK